MWDHKWGSYFFLTIKPYTLSDSNICHYLPILHYFKWYSSNHKRCLRNKPKLFTFVIDLYFILIKDKAYTMYGKWTNYLFAVKVWNWHVWNPSLPEIWACLKSELVWNLNFCVWLRNSHLSHFTLATPLQIFGHLNHWQACSRFRGHSRYRWH